ncbi:PIG-L family deacetylase [Actinoplanes sp. NPDC024001]|uniref:PIG-L family deacetylase n=1 Tax=Actinoplanes sp. NPDC024001 TaxID=3154598 RepID=UPI0033D3B0D9
MRLRRMLAAALIAGGVLVSPAASAPAAPGCTRTLNVVAHQDDDLLFINPDVSRDIADGRCVTTAFVTAGDAGRPAAYWRGREAGAMAAYAAMAGVANRWTADTVTLAGRKVLRRSLIGAPIKLLFLRLPDGHGYAVHGYQTLHKLFSGEIATIRAIDGTARYSRQALIDTLAAVMTAHQPRVVRTLDYTGSLGDGDHADHHSAAYFAQAAHRLYRTPHWLVGYQGYRAVQRPVNLPPEVREDKLRWFLAYASHDVRVCRTAAACRNGMYGPRFARRYPISNESVGR